MFEGKKVLWVAGGRDWDDRAFVREALKVAHWNGYDVLIGGAARGADLTAEAVWRNMQLPYVGIPARWNTYGKAAGYRRNTEIAHMRPDALLAFPGGRGTQHSRDIAREAGIDILDLI